MQMLLYMYMNMDMINVNVYDLFPAHNTEIQNSFSKSEIWFWFLNSIFWFWNFIFI